jgi:two-component system response regulator RegA
MKRSVLFVDDSAVARAATSQRLADRGVRVTALASLREVEAVDPTSFAAALLDIELADGSGPDVAARLRRQSPDLPIAFLTGGGQEGVVDQARAIGPVFCKMGDVDEAIVWVLAAAGF